MMETLIASFITFQVGVVAWFDFKTKKISNIWPIANFTLYLFLPLIFENLYAYEFKTWFVPIAILAVGFALFKLDIMGAGDSKYLFSLFLLIPEPLHELLLIKLCALTIIVGAALLSYRVVSQWERFKVVVFARAGSLKSFLGGKFTYAPVILAAWLWFLIEAGLR
tara:strand:+ start:2797 stop:3294 length:498 start_codon:yes stop_codon:yes gene_type:complete